MFLSLTPVFGSAFWAAASGSALSAPAGLASVFILLKAGGMQGAPARARFEGFILGRGLCQPATFPCSLACVMRCVQEPENGEFAIEAGALMLADNGECVASGASTRTAVNEREATIMPKSVYKGTFAFQPVLWS